MSLGPDELVAAIHANFQDFLLDEDMLTPDEMKIGSLVADQAITVLEILIRKRRDYGTRNINQTGHLGVAVRSMDKVNRYWNLAVSGGTPAVSETMEDTLHDLMGYALIGLGLIEGEW